MQALFNFKRNMQYYPIKIDVEEEGYPRVLDHFLWSVDETILTPNSFAEWYCEDAGKV